jgi:hypothetical protein
MKKILFKSSYVDLSGIIYNTFRIDILGKTIFSWKTSRKANWIDWQESKWWRLW